MPFPNKDVFDMYVLCLTLIIFIYFWDPQFLPWPKDNWVDVSPFYLHMDEGNIAT